MACVWANVLFFKPSFPNIFVKLQSYDLCLQIEDDLNFLLYAETDVKQPCVAEYFKWNRIIYHFQGEIIVISARETVSLKLYTDALHLWQFDTFAQRSAFQTLILFHYSW